MARYYIGGNSWTLTTGYNTCMAPSTNPFTMSLWAKYSSSVTLFRFIFGNSASSIALYYAEGAFVSKIVGTPYTLTLTSTVNDNEWHHLVFTRDSSFLLKAYVDGTLDTSTQGTSQDLTTTGGFRLSSTANGGVIDDLRLYNGVALSSTQIGNIYNSGMGVRVKENGFAELASNGFYTNFDDGSGTTVTGRKIVSGTWSAQNITATGITWYSGGVPFNHRQLASSYAEHTFYVNNTSRKIQFRFRGREQFAVKKFKVLTPQILSDR